MRLPRISPALALLLVSPAIGEVLSGSSPPLELLNPVSVLFLIGLYGCGALLVREIAFRWKKGWPTVFILGAAYGVIEEGLMCKSFFDPLWMDVGVLGSYGRWLGVNWVWSLELMIFHAVFSTSIAILLVWLAYPEDRYKPWVGGKTLIVAAGVLIAVVIIGFLVMTPYRPGPVLYGLGILTTAALIGLAYLWPAPAPVLCRSSILRPKWLVVLGFIWTSALFGISWVLPALNLGPLATFGLLGLLAIAGWLLLWRLYWAGDAFTDRHKLALASGALGFFVGLGVLLEMGGVLGMSVAAIVALILLLLLWRRLSRAKGICPGEIRI